jgi:methyltransferase (TIGR00027 family)
MEESKPSRTAMRVAMRRAAHQIMDNPRVLEDPLATRIIGPEAVERVREAQSGIQARMARSLRAFMSVRSRYAEDQLALAMTRGATQYVVLGAGLDTFAYRNPYPESQLRVFEVDYPSTQIWKRQKLDASQISIPTSVTYAPVDFEKQTLAEGLAAAGFDKTSPTFFSWLGVIMYLTESASTSTLSFIASIPSGGGVAFDYAVPRESLGFLGRMAFDAISHRVAAGGEPFRTFYEPSALAEYLRGMGFHDIEDLDSEAINARYFANRSDNLRVEGSLGRLLSAQI